MSQSEKLALGTVQFGLDYGIANSVGKVSSDDVEKCLSVAWRANIDTLDTAVAYGESEAVLGRVGVGQWKIISKLPPIPDGCIDVEGYVFDQAIQSLDRLKVSSLEGLLLHRPEQLIGPLGKEILHALTKVKLEGLSQKIGLSVYGPESLDTYFALAHFDLLQVPFNLLDRRIVTTGWARRLQEMGVEIHTRSSFLQGLLLMPAEARPVKFARWDKVWSRWDQWLTSSNLDPLEACIRFSLSCPDIDKVVVGVDSTQQLIEILRASEGHLPEPPDFGPIDVSLLNPALWNSL